MEEERYEDCERCGDRYTGESAIRSYLRTVEKANGLLTLCLTCIQHDEDKQRAYASALPEWRCCRIELYPAGTPLTAMQGHYIEAPTRNAAREEMMRRYPGESFSIKLWRQAGEPAAWSSIEERKD